MSTESEVIIDNNENVYDDIESIDFGDYILDRDYEEIDWNLFPRSFPTEEEPDTLMSDVNDMIDIDEMFNFH